MITTPVLRVSRVVAVLMIAGLACSCSTGTSATSPSSAVISSTAPATSVPPTTSSEADTAKQQAITAYLDMWTDVAAVAETSDWQSSRLGQHATGDALLTLSRAMYADHYNGLITKGRPVDHPQVTSMDPPAAPTTVMISDCGDSTNWLKYRADNGKLADDVPGGHRTITAEVQRSADGTWKVTQFAVQALGTC